MKYSNPVLTGFYPDPSVCKVENIYYLVTSSFEYFPGVPIFKSQDLIHWQQIGHCLTRESQLFLANARSSSGIFAPTLRYHKGRFYMSTTNVNLNRNFFVWTDDPAGEWSDPIWLDQGGIDSSLFFDEDGRTYLTSTGSDNHGIIMSEIELHSGELLAEPVEIWSGTGGAFPEAPHIYRIHGQYYLIIAEGGTEYGHMVTVARSNHVFGPYESCPHNPILTHRSKFSPIHATGHLDLIEAHDGSWWAVFLGIRPVGYPNRHHLGRETFLAPVHWSEDQWPIIGMDGMISLEMDVPTLPQVHVQPDPIRDEFDSQSLGFQWNFLRNPNTEDYSLNDRQGHLSLWGSNVTLNDVASPSFVGRRQQHFDFDCSTLLEFDPSVDGEEAGLTVLMNERFHYEIAILRTAGENKLILRRKLGSLWKIEHMLDCKSHQVILGIKADSENYYFYYQVPNGEKQFIGKGECSMLSTEVAGGFTGVYLGMYATGNGTRSVTPAYFDWFDYASVAPRN